MAQIKRAICHYAQRQFVYGMEINAQVSKYETFLCLEKKKNATMLILSNEMKE